jgi:hypothetical protein
MKRPSKILLAAGYCLLVLLLFKGIKLFESGAKEAYFSSITRHLVARASCVPPDKCLLGIYKPELPYSFEPLQQLEDSLGMRSTIISLYQTWGDRPEDRFQPALMNAIIARGRVPMITWEPWVTQFSDSTLKPLSQREHRYLKDIGEGRYDFYLREWARAAVSWGKPFFLRFAHEMTNPQYPWSYVNENRPDDYIHAWWHVHALFDSLGAKNVLWVWSPYRPGTLNYYPGHAYVDWLAMDIFNYGDLQNDNSRGLRWMSFDQLASPFYREFSALKKPIMVAEAGCSDMGGNREVWYREMIEQIGTKFSAVKMLVLFDNPADRTSRSQAIDWSIDGSSEITTEMKNTLLQGHFLFIKDYDKILNADNKRRR